MGTRLATLNIRHCGTKSAEALATRLLGESLDPRHLWCAAIDGAYVCGVYMPQNTAKLPYWAALIRDAGLTGIDLFDR